MSSDRLSVLCECTPVYDTQYDMESAVTPTEAVVEALTAVENVGPQELDPLYETIDGEALDRLFAHADETGESPAILSFTVDGWNVFVSGDGQIRVCDPDVTVDPAPAFDRVAGD